MARLKNRVRVKAVGPDLRALVLADLIEYRDAVIARNGPDSFLLANPGFRRIAALKAGLTISVRGSEVRSYVPPGPVDEPIIYQLSSDNRLAAPEVENKRAGRSSTLP
jgi:hypothetical protein